DPVDDAHAVGGEPRAVAGQGDDEPLRPHAAEAARLLDEEPGGSRAGGADRGAAARRAAAGDEQGDVGGHGNLARGFGVDGGGRTGGHGVVPRSREIPVFGGPWINSFFHDGMVSINLLREATDASDPEWFSRTEVSLRETLHRLIEVFRREFPEFRDCWLAKSGIQTGVRETYHIVGEYHLVKDDVVTPKAFPDTVAKGAHVIDIHE